ncbi:MAG: tetraacyldisaccharide 4'-kinase [Candidatus Tectimicrobiota bacterium]|nr:MAG: tetraacyldisaccharide 4'-kinase [Candidatus Tectomicrobia bacterium]
MSPEIACRTDVMALGSRRWRQRLLACLYGQPPPSPSWALALRLLHGLASLYGAAVALRAAAYRAGLRQPRRLPCRVLSIGNLTVGGTGKTPLALWVARWYQKAGCRVAVLCRGYGGTLKGRFGVASCGEGPQQPWHVVGDEAYFLAQALPGIPVLAGKDRYAAGRYACAAFGSEVVLLDDGFQHWRLARDLDVVLLDASNPLGAGALLPRGILREPLPALERADVVVVTRAPAAAAAALPAPLRPWLAQKPLCALTLQAEALVGGAGETYPLAFLQGQRAVAFAGIGNPGAFLATLQSLGCEVPVLLCFPDHHPYRAADWQAIAEVARQRQATCLVTTEKDAVRLSPAWPAPVPLYRLRVGVSFTAGAEDFGQHLQRLLPEGKR